MNKYKSILETLDYFLAKAFETIYNDSIIGYTSSGIKTLPKYEQETIERNFIKLTIELMGTQNENVLVNFFGNNKVLIDNIVLYFRQRLSRDQLAQLFQEQIKDE